MKDGCHGHEQGKRDSRHRRQPGGNASCCGKEEPGRAEYLGNTDNLNQGAALRIVLVGLRSHAGRLICTKRYRRNREDIQCVRSPRNPKLGFY